MKRIKLLILTLPALFAVASCNYLSDTPAEYLNPEKLFTDERWAEQNLRMAFSYLPTGFNRYSGAFLDASTDDAAYVLDNAAINLISRSLLSLANPGEGYWEDGYKGVRRTIYFETHIGKLTRIPSFTDEMVEKRKLEWTGESKTLRALFYFELVKRYGGVPVVKELITEEEARTLTRGSFEECIEYIVELCDEAVSILPETNVFGRIGKGGALAVKAKALAYAASELYDNASGPLWGYTSGSRSDRQKRAARALADVINYEVNGTPAYGLINDYSQVATNVSATNTEVILAAPAANNNTLERNLYPPTLLGNGSTFPSQNLVDAYEYKGTYNPANPYLNKDPRFDMTIVYDQSVLGARGTIYTRTGEGSTQDGLNAVINKSTITGYYLRKFLAPSINFTLATPGNTTRMFPIIRLADMLLLYAEMANHAWGPDSDPENLGLTALDAINKVRGRNGVAMPAIGNTVTQAELVVKIKNERRVELAFEDQRYFDLRRWKDAEDVLVKPLKGMKVEMVESILSYTDITVDNKRDFNPKMYFAPIPYTETKANPNLTQNPDWN